jgi:hypothetical protein
MQLMLDVEEYGNQLSQFGLDPAQLASYQALLRSVQENRNNSSAAATPANTK